MKLAGSTRRNVLENEFAIEYANRRYIIGENSGAAVLTEDIGTSAVTVLSATHVYIVLVCVYIALC